MTQRPLTPEFDRSSMQEPHVLKIPRLAPARRITAVGGLLPVAVAQPFDGRKRFVRVTGSI